MEGFIPSGTVGLLFTAGALVSLWLFSIAPKVIAKIGIYKYLLIAITLELIGIVGLALSPYPIMIVIAFILHQAAIPMILYCLDVFLEHVSKDESNTGSLRGAYLTLANITLVLSPTIVGFLLLSLSFRYIYGISAILLIPLILVSAYWLKSIKAEPPSHTKIIETLWSVWKHKDIRFGMLAHYILQFFYATMVIYLPLYLIHTVGFNWSELGALFTIMLLPFVLFEMPVGWLADKKYGEKELMIFGFIISAVAAFLISIPQTPTFFIWAVILFSSRVGASIAEITTETYFFKHVKGKDSDVISLFRMSRPLSYIVAPTIATISLAFSGMSTIFIVLAIITILGALFATQIVDTK